MSTLFDRLAAHALGHADVLTPRRPQPFEETGRYGGPGWNPWWERSAGNEPLPPLQDNATLGEGAWDAAQDRSGQDNPEQPPAAGVPMRGGDQPRNSGVPPLRTPAAEPPLQQGDPGPRPLRAPGGTASLQPLRIFPSPRGQAEPPPLPAARPRSESVKPEGSTAAEESSGAENPLQRSFRENSRERGSAAEQGGETTGPLASAWIVPRQPAPGAAPPTAARVQAAGLPDADARPSARGPRNRQSAAPVLPDGALRPREHRAAAGSERRSGPSQQPETIVRVTIGSVVVRAAAPAADQPGPRSPGLAEPQTSLAQYLERRRGGFR